ncbi:MAG: alpha/beta fold hydrolase [Deltaproteobacteria bacterium]|jgi:pimeloyl-ACP methyl ester carboxylesterase|nr:alpha/beta fold hydrolase [Deltaproteobacteria bacterium]MBW2533899.1 alpha/beta fold hydrolase [Deltaproteobacteria bacterium]
MPPGTAHHIELAYETIGEGEPLLLVMGLGSQLVYWPDSFCAALASQGLQVIRYDHRDVGLSTKMVDAPRVDVRRLFARWLVGLPIAAPYTLVDMADDAVRLLDRLGIESAHVVGISMGGMIGQTMAIRHPERLRTLTSWASHTGERHWYAGSPRAMRVLLGPAPRDREDAMDRAVDFYRVVRSTAYPFDVGQVRDRAARAHDRCFYPIGFGRHVAAILATGPRSQALRFVRVPTLVLHGSADPLIRPAAGRATARAIPGATWRLIDGLGHDLPDGAAELVADTIAAHARSHDSALH